MSLLKELKPAAGSKTRPKKRLGRGSGSGKGTTAGRGNKGQNSRSGGGVRLGFEGGQMPLQRRLPKRGFTNLFRKEYTVVNVKDLEQCFEDGAVVGPAELVEAGLVRKMRDGVKILGDGELKKGLTVKAHRFTKTAREKIEAAGGKVEEA